MEDHWSVSGETPHCCLRYYPLTLPTGLAADTRCVGVARVGSESQTIAQDALRHIHR